VWQKGLVKMNNKARSLAETKARRQVITKSRAKDKVLELAFTNFGVHLTLDGYQGDASKLNDFKLVYKVLDELPTKLGMHKLMPPYVVTAPGNDKKDPGGISGFVMIAESHISIHTFPGKKFVSIDVYTCQDRLAATRIINYFKDVFELQDVETNVVKRGMKFPVYCLTDEY